MKTTREKLLACIGMLTLATTAYAKERPNIIFILTDDQPYALLGCTGHPIVETPNIDRLAKDGVLFTNAHVSSAISTPSRTCILTGRYERSHGVNFNSSTSVSEEGWAEAYPNLLRTGGYYTGYVGKNHTPIGKGGYSSGVMEQSYDYWYAGHEHLRFYPKQVHKIFKDAKADTQVEILEEGVMDFLSPNERNLKGALHFMESRPADKPFFLNLCFNLPHGAGTGSMQMKPTDPEIYRTLYRDLEIPLPKNYIARADIKTPRLPADLLKAEDRQTGYDYVDTPEKLRERNIREMEAVHGIDLLVGKLVKELKRQKLDKNTIIIFAADHGIMNGEYGLGGKSLCYELCTHIPFIVYDPTTRRTHGTVSDELVMTVDIAPTILDYAKVEAPASYQGFTLTPLLRKEKKAVREYAFTENLWSTHFGNPRCESVQNKEWKYIRYYKNDNTSATKKIDQLKAMKLSPNFIYRTDLTDFLRYRVFVEARFNGEEPVYEELFHLANDPLEAVNLAGSNQYSEVLEQLRAQCDIELKMARGKGQPKVDLYVSEVDDVIIPQ